MTRQEEIVTLRKYPRHYLWNKPRSKWTSEDIENLKTGVTKGRSYFIEEPKKPHHNLGKSYHKTPIVFVSKEKKQEFQSVKELSNHVDVPYQSLVNILNGISPQREEFQIFKSKINQ